MINPKYISTIFVVSLLWISLSALKSKTLPSTKSSINPIIDTAGPNQPHSEKILFYLHRSVNNNIIVYELNIDDKGNLNSSNPVHAYWIRNTEGGKKEELSYIQRRFAYGVEHKLYDPKHHTFKINFVSYNKKEIFLSKSKTDGKYHAYLTVNNKTIQLTKIFVQIQGGSFWVPNIPYIEVSGKDAATGHFIKERIKP